MSPALEQVFNNGESQVPTETLDRLKTAYDHYTFADFSHLDYGSAPSYDQGRRITQEINSLFEMLQLGTQDTTEISTDDAKKMVYKLLEEGIANITKDGQLVLYKGRHPLSQRLSSNQKLSKDMETLFNSSLSNIRDAAFGSVVDYPRSELVKAQEASMRPQDKSDTRAIKAVEIRLNAMEAIKANEAVVMQIANEETINKELAIETLFRLLESTATLGPGEIIAMAAKLYRAEHDSPSNSSHRNNEIKREAVDFGRKYLSGITRLQNLFDQDYQAEKPSTRAARASAAAHVVGL